MNCTPSVQLYNINSRKRGVNPLNFFRSSGVARICCEGGKLEIMSWGTRGGLQGRVQQLLTVTNSFVTNAHTGRKSCELLTSAPADLANYTIFG